MKILSKILWTAMKVFLALGAVPLIGVAIIVHGAVAAYRWAELRAVYSGDENARAKAEWRLN